MHKIPVKIVLIIGLLVLPATAWPEEMKPAYPAPAPPQDSSGLGTGVQRTMTLLATSTPGHRNRVRILFYGQSITEQDWWKRVADDLRRRFPNADLDIANRAIGGFAAQRLIWPAEHDLYPFYPDLLIFHVYGSNKEYEEIICTTRRRTTAEILMQNDHLTRWPPAVIDRAKDKGAWWDDLMNRQFLPTTGRKYGCGLADVRGGWLSYLKTNHLEPKALLSDGVHLNDHGNYLMAELIKRHLVYRPDLPDSGWKDLVRTYEVGKDLKWQDGKLTLAFEGNRVDVLAAALPGESGAWHAPKAQVRIDGKKPSQHPNLYRIPRPTPGPWSPLALVRVDHDQPLQAEDWILKVTKVNSDGTAWEYDVTGSRTGPDGHGSGSARFVSKSGRVRIEPEAWFRAGKVPPGYEIRWQVLPTFVDAYEAPQVKVEAREYSTTLAMGLSNSRHLLEIVAGDGKTVPIRAVRVYRPGLK